ncbi:MAG TPA: FtsQ-type POTRA domain-containing protein, partial [Gaiellaceae bacterium]|nr:FtsQ-type POTRA domain-containing protein [Gaiellaceae bacterium]
MTSHTLLRNLWDGRIVSATPAADTAEEVVLLVSPGTRRMRADFDALPPPAWELRALTWRPPPVAVVHRRRRRHFVGVFPDGWDVVIRPSGRRRAMSSIVHPRRRSGTRSRRSRWRLRRCRPAGTSCLRPLRGSGRDRPRRGSRRGGELVVVASSRRTIARVAALPAAVRLPELRAVVPSARSVGVGLALLVVAFAAYFGARTMSVFAVRQIEVAGGSPLAREQAADALRPVIGASLLAVDSTLLERRLTQVPQVASVRFDRDFPHTLRVFVVPEHPVLLLRRGKVGWVVSARGRVMRSVTNTRTSSLPRMWVPPRTKVVVGSM